MNVILVGRVTYLELLVVGVACNGARYTEYGKMRRGINWEVRSRTRADSALECTCATQIDSLSDVA